MTAASQTGIPTPSDAATRWPLRRHNGRLAPAGWVALAVLCVAVFLTALDQTVVVTALTQMIGAVNVPLTEPDRAAWIVSGYLLGYVIAMPLMGRVADVFGRRRVFAICLTIFALGSLLCVAAPSLGADVAPDFTTPIGAILTPFYNGVQALLPALANLGVDTRSPGLDVLVAARFIQAVGGGALVPVAMAVGGDLFGLERRGLALGLIGAVTEAGGVLGPLWGAWLTATWGWQWIFAVNIPVAALLLAAGLATIPARRGPRERIDLLGALLFGAALTCLTLGLGAQGTGSALDTTAQLHTDPRFLIASAALLALFLAVEARVRHPVVGPAMFARRGFAAASALSLLVGVALIVALVEIPLYMASVLNLDPIPAGLALLRMTALIPVGALAGGWLSGRIGCPPTAALGVACTALGLFLMHLWPVSVGQLEVTLATVIAGAGFGLVIAPVSASALNASARTQTGVASAVVTMLRMTGMILGLAGLTAWGLTRFRVLVAALPIPGTPGGPPLTDQMKAAYEQGLTNALHTVYSDIFLAAAVIVLVGIIPALLLWRRADGGEDVAGAQGYVAPLA